MPRLHENGCDNMNFQLLLVTLLALFGYNIEPQPARLQRKLTLREKINCWTYKHRYEILFVIAIIAMITFVLVVFLVIGSATESGNVYNHMGDVI